MPADALSIPLCVTPRDANTVVAAPIGVDNATVRRTPEEINIGKCRCWTGKTARRAKGSPSAGECVRG